MKNLKSFFTSKINFRVAPTLLVIGTLLSTVVLADIQDEIRQFQDAVNYSQDNQGCRGIPYSDLQQECVQKQREKEKWCSESGPLTCNGLDNRVDRSSIERMKREYEESKDDNKRSSIKNELDNLREETAKNRNEVIKRLEITKYCAEYRKNVMDIFRYAKQKVYNETEQELKPMVEKLLTEYSRRDSGHEEALKNAQTANENCQGLIYQIDQLGTISTP